MPIDTTAADRYDTGIGDLVYFTLTAQEAAEAAEVVSRAADQFHSAESVAFLADAPVMGQELPRRLRSFLAGLRREEGGAACVISGFPVDEEAVGPTPLSWTRPGDRERTRREEMWLVLCGSLLGDAFGWATQQEGVIVHDIMPLRGHENSQLGSGSSELLWWHTEEAFHPYRCDYLGLMCLRNRDRVPTTFASIENVRLDPEVRQVLSEPRFIIRPDDSHLAEKAGPPVADGKESRLLEAARQRIRQMNQEPQRVSVLYGDVDAPYLAIDPFYMGVADDDQQARDALTQICGAIDDAIQSVALAAGEILFIDNFRAVHGRKPFHARYDGTDRWLKRINVTRDLRKSRAQRATSTSRVIY